MATFDHERAHMAANLVSDPPVPSMLKNYDACVKHFANNILNILISSLAVDSRCQSFTAQ